MVSYLNAQSILEIISESPVHAKATSNEKTLRRNDLKKSLKVRISSLALSAFLMLNLCGCMKWILEDGENLSWGDESNNDQNSNNKNNPLFKKFLKDDFFIFETGFRDEADLNKEKILDLDILGVTQRGELYYSYSSIKAKKDENGQVIFKKQPDPLLGGKEATLPVWEPIINYKIKSYNFTQARNNPNDEREIFAENDVQSQNAINEINRLHENVASQTKIIWGQSYDAYYRQTNLETGEEKLVSGNSDSTFDLATISKKDFSPILLGDNLIIKTEEDDNGFFKFNLLNYNAAEKKYSKKDITPFTFGPDFEFQTQISQSEFFKIFKEQFNIGDPFTGQYCFEIEKEARPSLSGLKTYYLEPESEPNEKVSGALFGKKNETVKIDGSIYVNIEAKIFGLDAEMIMVAKQAPNMQINDADIFYLSKLSIDEDTLIKSGKRLLLEDTSGNFYITKPLISLTETVLVETFDGIENKLKELINKHGKNSYADELLELLISQYDWFVKFSKKYNNGKIAAKDLQISQTNFEFSPDLNTEIGTFNLQPLVNKTKKTEELTEKDYEQISTSILNVICSVNLNEKNIKQLNLKDQNSNLPDYYKFIDNRYLISGYLDPAQSNETIAIIDLENSKIINWNVGNVPIDSIKERIKIADSKFLIKEKDSFKFFKLQDGIAVPINIGGAPQNNNVRKYEDVNWDQKAVYESIIPSTSPVGILLSLFSTTAITTIQQNKGIKFIKEGGEILDIDKDGIYYYCTLWKDKILAVGYNHLPNGVKQLYGDYDKYKSAIYLFDKPR